MNSKNQNILNATLFLAIVVCFVIGAIAYTPVLIIYFLGVLATLVIMKTANKNNKEFADTVTIFLSSLFFGYLLAFMVNINFLHEGVTFLYPDQMHFFEQAKVLSASNSIYEVYNKAFNSYYIEYKAVYFLFGFLAYIDKLVSGHVYFLPLLLSVVYVTALIPVFLYHTIKKISHGDLPLKGSLYYALATPIMAYSGFLLRDMHISLITMIVLYYMVNNITIFRIILILFLALIVFHMRQSSSLFILAMLAIYIHSSKTSRLNKFISVILGIVLLLFFLDNIISVIISTERRIDNYYLFTYSQLELKGGISKFLYNLPSPIKEIGIILFTLSSFPFFYGFSSISTFPQFIMILYLSIAKIGWFFIFFGVLYYIKPFFKTILKMQTKMWLYLFILFILFLFLNTSNMAFRRIIALLPIIYIPFVLFYSKLSKNKKINFKLLTLLTGTFLYGAYLLLLL